MHAWQLNEAKSRFSELVELALKEGPQLVTRHGQEAVVILSAKDYRQLIGKTPVLMDCLLNAPRGEALEIERPKDGIRHLVYFEISAGSCAPMKTTVKKRVAIVGAGIAGLSCATHLQALGLEVEVFEKSRGPSGRMSTREGDGWTADHGAQYFTARDPLFKHELDSWIDKGIAGRWNPKIGVFEDGQWRESRSNEQRYVANPGMNMVGKYLARTLTLHLNQTIDQLVPINNQ